MQEKRVVVTGVGAVTPVGIGAENFWKSLREGRGGCGPITRFDASAYRTRIAAEVKDFEIEQYVDKRDAKRMDRFVHYAVASSMMAVENAALTIDDGNRNRIGVLVGSGIGGIQTWEDQHAVLISRGPDRVSPFFIPMMICDMGSGMVSILLGAKGPNITVATACATATHSIGDAAEIIRRGAADAMIAGGAEAAITPMAVAGFASMRAMSQRNDDPDHASRPFDKERDGFVIGEGSGVVVLEELEFARKRGARILAEIVGYGTSGDAYHMTAPAPDGEGAARSMAAALRSAGMRPEEISYINAHGTSTDMNDKYESMAIRQVFGEYAGKLPVSSTKSMTGHLLGAAGGVEAIACVMAIRDSVVPPTINYEFPDPECDLDYVPNEARKVEVKSAMSNSFGFGGHNATLIVGKFEE